MMSLKKKTMNDDYYDSTFSNFDSMKERKEISKKSDLNFFYFAMV